MIVMLSTNQTLILFLIIRSEVKFALKGMYVFINIYANLHESGLIDFI